MIDPSLGILFMTRSVTDCDEGVWWVMMGEPPDHLRLNRAPSIHFAGVKNRIN